MPNPTTPDPALAPKPATEATLAAQRRAAATLPFEDRRDFDDAARGFLGTLEPPVIRRADGHVMIDLGRYDFLKTDEAPPTVHPGLWRHARLAAYHGLFEVVEGVYQIRGFDQANMTVVEGDTGVIVIDPLIYAETAHAALELYYRHRPRRPVVAVIYTHSHGDHFGGVKGVVDQADVDAGRVTVIAPEGFLKEAVSENIYAGNAMTRRALYQYGPVLARGPQGQVSAGLTATPAHGGSFTLIEPTDTVHTTGEKRTVDGVEMVFQMANGTEAPSEFMIHFPALRLFCAAEDAVHTMHNIYTLRGAEIRDAAGWWKKLDESIELFGAETDVVMAQHHWPRWGNADVVAFLEQQRDAYKYLHDQSLRLANHGHTLAELGDLVELPPSLAREWHVRGFYGTASHNAKGVYQRYLGWYDSHPARLDPLPPERSAPRYVAAMGGPDSVLTTAGEAFAAGEYRWVSELLTHLVFAEPDNTTARRLQADALEQLGYQAECATWRNEYLMGAFELRHGVRDLGAVKLATPDVLAAMTLEMLLDYLGIRLNGPRAWDRTAAFNWTFPQPDGTRRTFAVRLRNGVLAYTPDRTLDDADASVLWDRRAFERVLFGAGDLTTETADGTVRVTGDTSAMAGLFDLLDEFPFWFPIVTP
ncbi:alkyl/aryl-sulfatase [Streptacidiphilus anmyonensis]|uniref:alkyl/aryl-sulfatase n=1 Tax=Streptacidiphilus anmyonensis TaxID=405782 RepID=UPI00069487CE|nr:alkyl sulfatase dimerization domain-containing protein [Streptacidiphilus anmyonensis]